MEMNTEEFTTFINITANMSKTIGEQEEQMKQLNTRVEKNDAEMQRVLSENEALLRRVAELEEKLNEANRQILELTQKNVAKNVNINILNVFMSEGIIPLTAQLLDKNFHSMPWNAQMTCNWLVNNSLWDNVSADIIKVCKKATEVKDNPNATHNTFITGNVSSITNDVTMTGNDAVYNENNNKME